ncbi:cytochrome b/b6 domain-containing protein [Puia sp.]|uniref:cytochrome b/b6 domain-containing protein n=1 Tax=Puia sp. TaxID=2045100 RepID=UPI002F3F40CB
MKNQRFNSANRIIHWAIALNILFLLTTIFLRMGWMNINSMGVIIQKNLRQSGIQLSLKEAVAIGKEVRRPMWNYHYLAGYSMIGLYLIRMVNTMVQGVAFESPFAKRTTLQDKFKAWVYIAFYFLLAVSLFTGFMTLNGPKAWHDPMAFIHTKSVYYVVLFIAIHITGVLIADAGPEPGIVSRMISGEKGRPDTGMHKS